MARLIQLLLPAGVLLIAAFTARAGDRCFVCNEIITQTVYLSTDQVARQKRELCEPCAMLTTVCYLCGLPAKTGFTELSDGRILCARDVKSVVLDEAEAQRISSDVKSSLDRLFSRFISFPERNVTVELMDRVTLMEIYRIPGNDWDCPNTVGYTRPITNNGGVHYEIGLLAGLPAAELKSTCAHEYAHVWLNENLPPGRHDALHPDAREAFCELIAFRLMESAGEEWQKKLILTNAYTRGQIHLFLEADQRYGFNDVVEWMKFGRDNHLDRSDLGRLRDVETAPTAVGAARTKSTPSALVAVPAALPTTLTLRSLIWSDRRSSAMINDRTFEVTETGKVRLGATNVTVRCLKIRKDAVVIQRLDTGEELELKLKE